MLLIYEEVKYKDGLQAVLLILPKSRCRILQFGGDEQQG